MNLLETLRSDVARLSSELEALEAHKKLLEWKRDYLASLMKDDGTAPDEFRRTRIREMVVEVLRGADGPLSAMEIARRSIARGYPVAESQARSRISAVIAKNTASDQPLFVRVGRGAYQLREARSPATA